MANTDAYRAKLLKLAEDATKAIRTAREIAARPRNAIETLAKAPIGDFGPFEDACFRWSELDPTLDADFDISEIAQGLGLSRTAIEPVLAALRGNGPIELVLGNRPLDPRRSGMPQVGGNPGDQVFTFCGDSVIPTRGRSIRLRFGGRGAAAGARNRTLDFLDQDGKPAKEAIALVQDWAEAIVELGESILQPDRPQFAKLLPGASDRAVAARECLLRAFPRGLTGEQLVEKMRERGSSCTAQVLSQRVIPELRRLGAEIENRRGAGYYLVPLARAK